MAQLNRERPAATALPAEFLTLILKPTSNSTFREPGAFWTVHTVSQVKAAEGREDRTEEPVGIDEHGFGAVNLHPEQTD